MGFACSEAVVLGEGVDVVTVGLEEEKEGEQGRFYQYFTVPPHSMWIPFNLTMECFCSMDSIHFLMDSIHFLMDSTQSHHGFHIFPHGFHIFSYGFHTHHGFHIFPHGFHMDSTWIPYISTWIPHIDSISSMWNSYIPWN